MTSPGDQFERSRRSEHNRHTARIFVSCVGLGCLAIAGTMLFPAPQPLKTTRAEGHRVRLNLPAQVARGAGDAAAQTRLAGSHVSPGAQNQAEDHQPPGQVPFPPRKETLATQTVDGTEP